MSGKKGRSGRRKEPTTLMREALDKLSGDVPALIEQLKKLAFEKAIKAECPLCKHKHTVTLGGDIQALVYLLDRVLGKAKQSIDIESKVALPPEFVRNLLEEAWSRHKLSLLPHIEIIELEGGNDAVQEQGASEGSN